MIKLGQRLPKSLFQVHVKNSRFFLSYFLKKDDWPKAYAGRRLLVLAYNIFSNSCIQSLLFPYLFPLVIRISYCHLQQSYQKVLAVVSPFMRVGSSKHATTRRELTQPKREREREREREVFYTSR